MKKIVLGSLIVATALLAEVKPFVGANIGSANISGEATVGTTTFESGNNLNFAYGVKGGVIINTNHRAYLEYTGVSGDIGAGIDSDVYSIAANYDYLFELEKHKGTHPYVGLHLGYGNVELDDGAIKIDDSGMVYGVNLGIVQDINNNISLEIGYKFSYIDAEPSFSVIKTEIDPTHNVFVGLNFSF